MTNYDYPLLAAGYYLRLSVVLDSQDYAANTSTVTRRLYIQKGSGFGKFTGYSCGWASTVGAVRSGSIGGYNFGGYSQLTLDAGTEVIAHNSDGTKTLTVAGSFTETDPDPELGNGAVGGSFVLPRIPRFGKRWDGSAEVAIATAMRWDGTAEVPLTEAYRWDGSAEVRIS